MTRHCCAGDSMTSSEMLVHRLPRNVAETIPISMCASFPLSNHEKPSTQLQKAFAQPWSCQVETKNTSVSSTRQNRQANLHCSSRVCLATRTPHFSPSTHTPPPCRRLVLHCDADGYFELGRQVTARVKVDRAGHRLQLPCCDFAQATCRVPDAVV